MVKGEGKARGKVAGRVKVKSNRLPDYLIITSNWINYYYGPTWSLRHALSLINNLWPQCPNGGLRGRLRPDGGLYAD